MKKKHQVIIGLIVGISLSILLQHVLYGGTDNTYNIFFQLNRILEVLAR